MVSSPILWLKMEKNRNQNEEFGERPFLRSHNKWSWSISSQWQQIFKKELVRCNTMLCKKLAYKQILIWTWLEFHSFQLYWCRYDRLTETDPNTGLRHVQWYYGPQKRVLGIYSLSKEKAFLASDVKITTAFKVQRESRHWGLETIIYNREEEVKFMGLT
jgi:hemoglobin/transferrin/lactoferrin receptor protein